MQAQLHPVSKSQTARIQSPVLARTEEPAEYRVSTLAKSQIIEQALALLEIDLREGTAFHTPGAVKDYITLHNGRMLDQYREVFSVLFLDSQNRMLAIEEMFSGTLTQTSIYPREVVRAALRHNAAAVVLTHNHPSGSVQPSRADEALTQTLKSALALIDVRVLDHIITAGNKNLSMAEQGLI